MKKRVNPLAIVVFVVSIAAATAAARLGHPIKGGAYGFFSGA